MSGNTLEQMFAGLDKATAAERFVRYKDALQKSIDDADSGRYRLGTVADHPTAVKLRKVAASVDMDAIMERLAQVQKSASADDAEAVAKMVEIAKDWQVGVGGVSANPAAQPVPYDLQTPLKELVPLHTPLLNDIPSTDAGEGTATHWKQLDSLQGSGVGSLGGGISPFFSSQSTTNTFGSLSLRRGNKINYATSDHTATYVEWGLSDLVTDVAQYSGAGFANIRQLSRHALAWTHLHAKERAILYGRGNTGNGYVGSVGTPAGATIADGGTGGSVGAGTYYAVVSFVGGFGEAPSAVSGSVTVAASHKLTVTWTTPAASAGVTAVKVYVGTASTPGAQTLQTQTSNTNGTTGVTLSTYSTTGAAAPTADTSFDANGFDGLIPNICANGGYVNQVNGTWAASNPGTELQTAFQAMWLNNFATPSEIWMDVSVKVALGQALQKSGASLAYRIEMSNTNGVIGTAVTGIQNLASPNDEMVRFRVHPFMPAGTVILRSPHLPFPANGISATSEMRMVQGLLTIDWPRIQHTYDSSTYEFGTFIHYAPAWNGIFTGVTGVV